MLFRKICYATADENLMRQFEHLNIQNFMLQFDVIQTFNFVIGTSSFVSLSSHNSCTGCSAIPFVHSTMSFVNRTKTLRDMLGLVA